MLGSIGHVMMFVFALAALLVATPYVFLHISHSYVTVLTLSSSGEDRIRWPRDSFYDWFPEALVVLVALFFCGALTLAIAAPVGMLLGGEWAAGAGLVLLWLMLPFCVCSMLASPSKFLFIYPPLVLGLLRHPLGIVFVYAINLPFSAITAAGVWLIARGNIGGVVLVAIALPPCLLLHARSWGRLAWLALNYEGPRKKKKRRKRKPMADAEPLAVELDAIDDDTDGYGVDAVVAGAGDRLVTMTEHYDQQMEYDRKLRERGGHPQPDVRESPEPPTPATALFDKVIPFIAYPESAGEWFTLSFTSGLEAMLVHMVLAFGFGA